MITVGNKLVAGNMTVTIDNKLVTIGRILVAAGNIAVTDRNS
jgi:hypothetical protein